MTITVERLAEMLSASEVLGNRDVVLKGATSIEKAGPGDVTYANGIANLKKLSACSASAVILEPALAETLSVEKLPLSILVVHDALASFVQVLEHFYPRRSREVVGISPDADIHSTARIGENTCISPRVQIGADVVIGDNCVIYPGVYIGPGCQIGNNVTLCPNVVLYDGVLIGNRVLIEASSVIGGDGYGYRQLEGRHQRIPHFGKVRIEDDVEIGSCTVIDRAMISETVIGEGTKIDSLVMIAHNCEIGRHNMFVSQVGMAGSVTTDDYVVCAGQVGIADHVHLGEGAVFGARSAIHKNMPGGQAYLGTPAEPEGAAMRAILSLRKLPEMRKRFFELEKTVALLAEKLEGHSQNDDSSNCAA